jgi:hypothetical protein
MKNFYCAPTQVIFTDIGNGRAIGGVAFHSYVICGECGKAIRLENVEIINELPWVDISDEIIGDDFSTNMLISNAKNKNVGH